ncbi:MAG: DsrE family protein [Promethearchaeota archaeon]
MVESVIIICDQSPIGKNSATEAIRLGSGFSGLGEEIDCKVVFMNDSIYMLNKNADPTAIGMDSIEETLEMADLSDLELYIIDSALEDTGMTADDLIEYDNLKIINYKELIKMIEEANICFRY